jgi:hypothetical protein
MKVSGFLLWMKYISIKKELWKPEFVSSFIMGNIIFVKVLYRATERDKMQRK